MLAIVVFVLFCFSRAVLNGAVDVSDFTRQGMPRRVLSQKRNGAVLIVLHMKIRCHVHPRLQALH